MNNMNCITNLLRYVIFGFDLHTLIQSLIFIAQAADFMSSISETENPSTQTFKYISLHSPRHSMLRDNRTKRHEELGNFVGF